MCSPYEILDEAIEGSASSHPAPRFDGFKDFDDCHYCGFKDQSQLEAWFPNYRVLLLQENLTISEFVVEKAHILGHQAIFVKEDVTEIKTFYL